MARLTTPQQPPPDFDTINLARALSRLEAKVLAPVPSSELAHSSYERSKTAANLEYARTLLLRLEHTTANIKVQSRKHAAQATLLEQRALIKQLTDRLYELGRQDDGSHTHPPSSEDETILRLLVPAAPNPSHEAPSAQNPDPSPPSPLDRRKDDPDPTSTLRARRTLPSPPSAPTTTAHALSAPFPSKEASAPSPEAAALLGNAVSEQVALTDSMLELASALKKSARDFAGDLAADEDTVAATEGSLGKNKAGMDAATRRMGLLSKMSEGRWWWGRMVLYAMIFALWVVLILLVFVAPKLRL